MRMVFCSRLEAGGGGASNQARLILGMFTVYPAYGHIMVGGRVQITVECSSDIPGYDCQVCM